MSMAMIAYIKQNYSPETVEKLKKLYVFMTTVHRILVPRPIRDIINIIKLNGADKTKINFGCGYNPIPGWLNTDGGDGRIFAPPMLPGVINLDIWKFLKHVKNESTQFISSEQFFEHFDRQDGYQMIEEWYRILKKDGVLRIQTVDLEKEILVYLDKCEGVSWEKDVLPHRLKHIEHSTDSYCKLMPGEKYVRAMLLNNGFHMDGHRFIYDFESIKMSLERAGFKDIKRVPFGTSEHPELTGIDFHDGGDTGRHWIPQNVLLVEATKK